MIPRMIHYCWMSKDTFPEKIQKCIDSWKKYAPDFQIIRWDYDRFPRGESAWVDEAFDHKKYAFCADYFRCYALFHYGGIYLDSDVEMVRPFDDLLDLPYFIGQEFPHGHVSPEAAVVGSEKGWFFMDEMLKYYDQRHFVTKDGAMNTLPLPVLFNRCIMSHFECHLIDSRDEFINDSQIINLFGPSFFSPKDFMTGEIHVIPKTYSIHHFSGSWLENPKEKKKKFSVVDELSALKKMLFHTIKSLAKLFFFYEKKDLLVVSNTDLDRQFSWFWKTKCLSPLCGATISDEDYLKLVTLSCEKKEISIRFLKASQSYKFYKTNEELEVPVDWFPVISIMGTDIEIAYKNAVSPEEIIKCWDCQGKEGKELFWIYCSNDIDMLLQAKKLCREVVTIGRAGDILVNIDDDYDWRNRRLMLKLARYIRKNR